MKDLRAATHSVKPKGAPPAGPPLPPGVAEAFASLMQTLAPLVVRDDGFRLEPRMTPLGMRILLDLDADLFADVIAALDQAGLSFNTAT